MKPQGTPGSSRQVGTPLLVAFLGATVALAAWLAWEAVVAARSQRQVAEEVLGDYAAVAASESVRLSRDGLDDFLDDLFDDVPRFTRRESLPGPEAVADEAWRALREQGCRCPGLREPLLVFRHDLEGNTVVLAGDGDAPAGSGPEARVPSPDLSAVVAALHRHRTTPGAEVRYYGLTVLDAAGGAPRALLYNVTRGSEGEVRAVYGYLVPLPALGELVDGRLARASLLPRSVVGDTPQDSLLQVRVLGPGGEVMGRGGEASPSPYVTRSALPAELGGLVMEVAIRPEAADELVIGGLPRSRLPLLLGLFLVTVGVGAAGLVELRRSHELARLREDFVSSVSHELRTPLTQIRMLAELLEEEKLRTPEERARSTRIIRREAQRLTMLVENVLQFARSRAAPTGSGVAAPPAADVRQVVDEALALLDAVISRGDAVVEVDAPEVGSLRAAVHREALRRVVGNLLDNALKYGPAGQTVRLALDREDGRVRIAVEDEGPGVPRAEREAVWEPYRRLPRDVEARRPGSGLGLAVVRELALRYGGEARIEDASSGGARFVVTLPVAPAGEEG